MTAALRCCSIDDPEDDPPHVYLIAMPDDNDPREAATIAPDTEPAEAETNPEASPRPAIDPPPVIRDSYFEQAAKSFGEALLELRETRKEIAVGFGSQGSKLDEMATEFAANYKLLAGEFKSFRAVVEARLDDGERRFDEIEARLDDLKKEQLAAAVRQLEAAESITRLETELLELRANVAARPAQAPSA